MKSRSTKRQNRFRVKAAINETKCAAGKRIHGQSVWKHARRFNMGLKKIRRWFQETWNSGFVWFYQHTPFETCKGGFPVEKQKKLSEKSKEEFGEREKTTDL